jgi:hypothetical protein
MSNGIVAKNKTTEGRKMFDKKCTKLAAAMAFTLSAGAAQAANVAVNGGFETGSFNDGTPFASWQQFPGAGSQTIITTNPQAGTYAANLSCSGGICDSLIKNANVGIGTVTPGAAIDVSFWARGSTADGGVAFAELFSELDGGGTSKSELLGGAPLALNANPEVWTQFVYSTTLGPDVSGGITLQLKSSCGAASSCNADIYFDSASLDVSAVPVPAAAWLFGSGLLGLVGVARRRKS